MPNKNNIVRIVIALLITAVLALVIVTVWNLVSSQRDRADITLTFVVVPVEDTESTEKTFEPILERLEQETGIEFRLMTVTDYASAVEAMKYGHADIGLFGPFAYVLATEEADVEAVFVTQRDGEIGYNGYIISRIDLEDLNGATFAFVDPGSASGYQVPMVYIENEGIELGRVLFAGSHQAVIEAVKNGSVDAGAISDVRWLQGVEAGVIDESEMKIFWVSDLVPTSPFAVRKDMDPELRELFVNTMLEMPQELLVGLGSNAERFAPVTDSHYDFIREILRFSE